MPRLPKVNLDAAIKTAATSKKEKLTPIETAIANIEKAFGNNKEKDKTKFFIQKYSDRAKEVKECISFGYDVVDAASNCKGVPRGKMVEIFGPESGGKSFLTLKLIASAQKQGLQCCLADIEQSFDPDWARQNGVDVDNLYLIDEPMSAENAMNYVNGLCACGQFGLVVVDSTAALVPQQELEGSIEEQNYALLARVMSKACRQIMANCGRTGTTCVFINQIRDKMNSTGRGDTTTTPGGKALKFYCHQRIRVVPGETITVAEGETKVVVARESYVTFVKNKVARPFGSCKMRIVFDAAMLNPVVKLCSLARAKAYKAIRMYNGVFTIDKELVEGAKKNLDTGATNIVALANYIIKNNMVIPILEHCIEIEKELPEDTDAPKIPKDVRDMLEDPTLIKSPGEVETKVITEGESVSDGSNATESDIKSEDGSELKFDD